MKGYRSRSRQSGFAAFNLAGRAVVSGWASKSGSARQCDLDLVSVEVGGGPGARPQGRSLKLRRGDSEELQSHSGWSYKCPAPGCRLLEWEPPRGTAAESSVQAQPPRAPQPAPFCANVQPGSGPVERAAGGRPGEALEGSGRVLKPLPQGRIAGGRGGRHLYRPEGCWLVS